MTLKVSDLDVLMNKYITYISFSHFCFYGKLVIIHAHTIVQGVHIALSCVCQMDAKIVLQNSIENYSPVRLLGQ